ncbi:MAG: GHKL domain-containing protein [Candidatus Omnitrophica bacterium]|nr:GHKL domain-containing protein [Candidatus Omnitrophota bacterium]
MNIYSISLLLACVFNLFIGLFVYFKNPKEKVNRFFGIYYIVLTMWVFGCFMESSVGTAQDALFWDKILYTGCILAAPLYLHFCYIITGKSNKSKLLYFSYLTAIIWLIFNFSSSLRPFFINDVVHKYWYRFIAVPGFLWYVYVLWFNLLVTMMFVVLFKYFLHSSGIKRLQAKYLLFAFLIMISAGSFYFLLLLNISSPPVDPYLLILFGVIMSYAIVRHQLMDIEVIIKKSLVFAGMFAFIFGIYIGITLIISQFVAGGKIFSLMISALIITVTLRPLENWLVNITDKFLFQKKYEYKQILRAFIDEVVTVLNLDEIVNSTLKLLDQTLHPYTAGVFILNKVDDKFQLYNSSGLEDKDMVFTSESKLLAFFKKTHGPSVIKQIDGITGVNPEIAVEMTKLKAVIALPFMLHNDLIGFISLGKKKSDEEYTKDDLDVLLDLARTEAIAIGNAQLLTEAAQSERRAAIGTMAAGINHEIGNPLNIMSNKIQVFKLARQKGLFKDKPSEGILDEAEKALDECLKQTERISIITRKLSNFAKPSKEFKPDLVNIPQEVDETLFIVGHELDLERIAVKKEFSAEPQRILADKYDIQQILFNIIRNAGQAIEGQGKIIIRVMPTRDGKVHIEVEDTGKGIPEDKIHKVFEPFFTTKGSKGGTGLGLSIVRQLVRRNKGEITFRSLAGIGTTFIIAFPKAG